MLFTRKKTWGVKKAIIGPYQGTVPLSQFFGNVRIRRLVAHGVARIGSDDGFMLPLKPHADMQVDADARDVFIATDKFCDIIVITD